ncbi:MAG TPA: bifunctional [glutamate--ammonia ligase]-adenylyl-L-tyrosine phosphorylase/[glutamate--ammonia-ligase] adenylyltransferase [Myxococcaceae bacterium]|nr:bifunctional [glutamate--ammonia ligase]-adenylyl-L-tyrosine phosphorylase/[glutamate--ammonia-ligase] adenylyltransferase [Myxococcaceae bacterium]
MFQNPKRAQKELAAVGAALGEPARARAEARAAEAADPDALVAAFERALPSLQATGRDAASLVDPLARLLEASELAARTLASRPGLLRWLLGSRTLGGPWPAAAYLRQARAAARVARPRGHDAFLRALRRFKYRELLRITYRDVVLQAPAAEIGRELASLAQALISAATDAAYASFTERYGEAEEEPGFCVLGLGKLGGEDLNFSSDVDLIYLYREGGLTRGGREAAIPAVQLYTRIAESITRSLSSVTAEGACYRVDLNLRPQGRAGAIVLSLAQTVAYYETHGRTWERSALLKARVVAGDASLGDELLSSLQPFLWRRSLDLSAVEALREMKAQIDLRGKASPSDVKLGPGGIREVEFFASALQLLHGGKNTLLRERHTARALRRLEQAGLLSATDADALEEAYLFLRRVENRLQEHAEEQTQQLPEEPVDRKRLARSLGYPGWPELDRELTRHRGIVARAFATLLGQTAREEVPDEPLLALALDLDAPLKERIIALEQRGFADPDRALAALERLSRAPESPFAAGHGTLHGLKLLAEVARTADPDQALQHFSDFVARLHTPQGYLSLLSSHPSAARRLLNLFGQSDYLSRFFLRHPELLDSLVLPAEEPRKPPERIRQELSARALRHQDAEGRLGALRRYKNEEVLRIGLGDIQDELTVPEVAAQLSALADGALDEALALAEEEVKERHGEPSKPGGRDRLVVLGMGKLGGRELGYHSDLDLIFLYSGDGQVETAGGARGKVSHHEYFARIAQRLLAFLQMQFREGLLYQIDARLRPSGNQGALVVSTGAFLEHHDKRAQLWERQALIKARGAAGALEVFEALRPRLHHLVYERPLPENAAAEIDRLRGRMEREIAKETADQLDLKSGRGGLVDVEFAVQYLQLVHGGASPGVRSTNTLEALAALQAEGAIDASRAERLRRGYLFHRRVESRLRLVHGRSISNLPTHGRPLQLLARRLGYLGEGVGEAFLAEYRATAAQVREAYAAILRA